MTPWMLAFYKKLKEKKAHTHRQETKVMLL